MKPKHIIFFDGECILCNGFVDLLLRVDRQNKFFFASLQGSTAKNTLSASQLHEMKTIVYYKNSQESYTKSTAVIEILTNLGGPWKALNILRIIPRFISDMVYDLIAKYRNNIFGTRQCRMPTKEDKDKILS